MNNKPYTINRIILITIVFLLTLTGLRFAWAMYYEMPTIELAEKGVIDLREVTFNHKDSFKLDGDWSFYPSEFLSAPSTDTAQHQDNKQFLSVPGDWRKAFEDNDIPTHGYGTYHLKIHLPDDDQQLYSLRFESISTASNVYIDGKLIAKSGNVAENASRSAGEPGPFHGVFHTTKNEVDLMIQVSNFGHPLWGGISESITIGTEQAITKHETQSSALQIAVGVVYLLHGLYAFVIYYFGKGKYLKEILCFSLLLTIYAFGIVIDDEVVLQLPITLEQHYKLLLFIYLTVLMLLVTFIKQLFKLNTRIYKWLFAVYFGITISEFIVPFEHFKYVGIAVILFYFISITFLIVKTITIIRKGSQRGIFVLLFIISYTSNIIWGAAIKLDTIEIPYYPFDFLFGIVTIAFVLFKHHIQMAHINQEQGEKLQALNKRKDEFLMNTAHEIRNPLHGIITIAQSILHDKKEHLSSKNRENLKLLIQVGKRMNFTLNDILDMDKLKDEVFRLNKESISLHAVTTGVLDMVHFMTEKKNIKLRLTISSSFPPVYADENRLIQILFNLIHNAVKFTNEGVIHISAEGKDGMAIIYIKDTGIGMCEKTQENIFQRYEQGDTSMAAIGGGIGLGLHISKQLVELHNGTISVKSNEKIGSVFSFTLPLANQETTKVHHNEYVPPLEQKEQLKDLEDPIHDGERPQVLIVDDDPVNLRVIQSLLEADYHIYTAINGETALEIIHKKELDLIIADVMMPKISGYALTRRVRKQFTVAELPILLLTARNNQEDIYTGFNVGANDYVAKPVDALELKARVHGLTQLKQSINEQLRMEAAWLQAQIQPHFLMNTLNTIASLGEIDHTRMVKLLDQFGNYLYRSFAGQNTKSLVSLKDELALTRSYLYIEQERFNNRVCIQWQVDNHLDFQLPPLSIQPIVENAVRHGILKKVEGGTVTIRIIESENNYEVSIHDNGVGMSKEKIKALLQDNPNNSEGIGISNTNRRLKQMYGSGLKISSPLNDGTTIYFCIPKKE